MLQINPVVGDLSGNAERIAGCVRQAHELGATLAVAPELSLLGYLPRDLLLDEAFIEAGLETLDRLAARLSDTIPVLVGTATPNPESDGRPLFNTAALLDGGRVANRCHKSLLPTYDVFDEDRYFEPWSGDSVITVAGVRVGVSICEDVWNSGQMGSRRRYHHDPILDLVSEQADVVVNLSASPFAMGKHVARERMLGEVAAAHETPLVYVNQVGGNDDLVFDGRSCAFDENGKLVARAKGFVEDLVIVNLDDPEVQVADDDFNPEAEIDRALVLGTRDYVRKCGFERVLLGISGGIDSAVTAVVATRALGAANVLGVLMPSPHSSEGSVKDARALAHALGIETIELPIADIMESFDEVLEPAFDGYASDVTEENIQARIRGNLLMALSNKYGAMLLTTGNKSELAVGYCTIYGDMSGGLAVISDVPKTLVYRLAEWYNREQNLIPDETIAKPPSAELRPEQKDEDSLPPYEVLDEILARHVEHHESAERIIAAGFDPEVVRRVLELVHNAEFKRQQAAPGLKVTDRAFGTGWRMPIAAKNWEACP